MKKRAFTLVEVLISITILAISIGVASLIFRNAVLQPKKLQSTKVDSSLASSQMEQKLNELKYDSNIPGSEEYNVVFKFGEIQKRPKGIFISFDDVIKSGKDVKAGDKLITFVGIGHHEPGIPLVDHVYFINNKRFLYMPMFTYTNATYSGSSSIKVNYSKTGSTLSGKVLTDANSETKKYLKKIRLKYLKSKWQSDFGNEIYTPYTDSGFYFLGQRDFNESSFDYMGFSVDGLEKAEVMDARYTLAGYRSNRNMHGNVAQEDDSIANKKYQIRKDTRMEYLDAIDRDYILESSTLNINGYASPPKISIYDDLSPQDAKNNTLRIIGLPFLENIYAYYDYNLAIGKSSRENKYYSLFDMENVGKTSYPYSLKKVGTKYLFTWGANDVLQMTNFKNENTPPKISVSKGFLNTIEVPSESATVLEVPDVKKPYGNTVYHDLHDGNKATPVLSLNNSDGGAYTIIMKLKIHHADEANRAPINLVSANIGKDGQRIDNKHSAFGIYADSKGDLYSMSYQSGGYFNGSQPLDVNLYDSNLYQSGHFKFDRLGGNLQENQREGFVILAFTIRTNVSSSGFRSSYLMATMLKKSEREEDGTWKLNTVSQKIFGDGTVKASAKWIPLDYDKFDFISDIDGNSKTKFQNHEKEDFIELANIVVYKDELYRKEIISSTSSEPSLNDLQNLMMDYLYRLYLTERERDQGGFDRFYMHKYRNYRKEQALPKD